MKIHTETAHCHKCEKLKKTKDLYKLTWRYTDKTRKYLGSRRYMIHTGYTWLCKKCLKLATQL